MAFLTLRLASSQNNDNGNDVIVSTRKMLDMFELVEEQVFEDRINLSAVEDTIVINIDLAPVTHTGMHAFVALCKLMHAVDMYNNDSFVAVRRFAEAHRALGVQIAGLIDFFRPKRFLQRRLPFFDECGLPLFVFGRCFWTPPSEKHGTCDEPQYASEIDHFDVEYNAYMYIEIADVMKGGKVVDTVCVRPMTVVDIKEVVGGWIVIFDDDTYIEFASVFKADDHRNLAAWADDHRNLAAEIRACAMKVIQTAVEANNPGMKIFDAMMAHVCNNSNFFFACDMSVNSGGLNTTAVETLIEQLPGVNPYVRTFVNAAIRSRCKAIMGVFNRKRTRCDWRPDSCWVVKNMSLIHNICEDGIYTIRLECALDDGNAGDMADAF